MTAGGSVLAHGIGGRQDLPIPLPAALLGAVVALLVTFVVLALGWRRSRFRGDAAGRPLPVALARVLDSAALRWGVRLLGLAAGAWLVVILVAGSDSPAENAAPGVLYVLLWVWLPLASVLLGPVWRAISPLRTMHLLLARISRNPPERGLVELPRRWGYWPAAVILAGFVWLELVPRDRATVPVVFLAFAAYAGLMLGGAAVFGSRWFAQADPFEVYSSLAARLAPVGRRRDGALVLRNPFDGLDSQPPTPGLAAVVLVLLGSTAFDSLTGHPQWLRFVQDSQWPTLVATLGLAATIGVIAVAYAAATWAGPATADRAAADRAAEDRAAADRGRLRALFAHSLLPIVIGYMVAHYYSLAVLEGQRTIILAADPLGTGDNLLGLTSADVDSTLVTASGVATLQVLAVVAGHIAGAVAAHDRAVRVFPPQRATVGQLPLLMLMVGYTYLGLSLLFAA